MAVIIISPRMERLRPGSWLPLPALRSAQLSTPPAAKVSKFLVSKPKPAAAQKSKSNSNSTNARALALLSTSPAAAKISRPVAQKTQQHQALTQAANTSTKHSKSKPVAAQSGRFWLLPRRPPKFLSPAGAEEHTATSGTNCALTQAPSHQAEQEQAGSSSVRPPGWVSPLLASGSWFRGLWLLPRASPNRSSS
jgi:hypothetical protein